MTKTFVEPIRLFPSSKPNKGNVLEAENNIERAWNNRNIPWDIPSESNDIIGGRKLSRHDIKKLCGL